MDFQRCGQKTTKKNEKPRMFVAVDDLMTDRQGTKLARRPSKETVKVAE